MSQKYKYGSTSALPIKKIKNIPVMVPTVRTQSECSTNAENKHVLSRGQPGLPQSLLGKRNKKPVLTEYNQNLVKQKPLRSICQGGSQSKISKSVPDLLRVTRIAAKEKVLSLSRIPKKKSTLEKSDTQKPGHFKQNIKEKQSLPPVNFSCPLSSSKINRMEESASGMKSVADKKMVESDERKKSYGETDDSIGTFNSEEIVDLLRNDSLLKHVESFELDKSSKRNSSEFEDCVDSFFSDQTVFNLLKSSDFLNISGSKQSFFSDNPLGLSMLEDLDNLTPELSELNNAIDRTPSAEDLPMECEGTSSRLLGLDARSTSPAEEVPPESLSSKTPNAAVSIITSITSIISLDTGYQGDGELSRPESRNTENESRLPKLPIIENGIPVKAINFDDGKTMTDSDFFTESDADVHDDLSAAAAEIGSGKGDRRAQVIDGTLYGGAFIQAHTVTKHDNEPNTGVSDQSTNRIDPTNSNEDMESSGIYSDLEKKPEEVSLKENELISYLITEQMKTIQNLALSAFERNSKLETYKDGIVKSSSAESSSTVAEMASIKTTLPSVKTGDKSDRKEPSGKKTKPPVRTATSKIKALIDRSSNNVEPRMKTVKKGKWDAVMDKIAQGREENKYTPSKFRDVKSKVFLSMNSTFNSRKNEEEPKTIPRTKNCLQKARSRRSTRIRSLESSLVSPKSKLSRTSASPNSSQRSSLSDISLSGTSHQKSSNRGNKKRDSISPPSNESTNSNTPTRKLNNNDESISTANRGNPNKNSDLQNGNVPRTPSSTVLPAMKTPSIRKTPTPKRNETVGPNLHRTGSVPLKDSNHNGIVSKSGSAVAIGNKVKSAQPFQNKPIKTSTTTTRGSNTVQVKNGCLLAVAKETNKTLLKQLKHSSRAFESLAILFSYCANDLDAFSTPQLKQKLEAEKNKFTQAQSDLEDLQSKLIRVREELNDKDYAIISLKNENESLKKLVENLEGKLSVVSDQVREAESELLKECESNRCLRRELSDKTDKYESEKENLAGFLLEAKKEFRDIKGEYDKCLAENQRLVELVSKRQNEVDRLWKEIAEIEEKSRQRRSESKERSSNEALSTPVLEKSHWGSLNATPNPKCLESEVESLRQVLALKTDEMTELRRQVMSLRENADRVPKLVSTNTMLEGKVEDLQTQLSSQTETIRDMFKTNEHLNEELKSANIQKTRLTHKNEELQYKLKQYAEAMKQLVNQTNFFESSIGAEFLPSKSSPRKNDSINSQMKAVIEKSDSVSYMLQMTEDTSEIVTNIIRRAGSLRLPSREHTLPKKKRAKASSVSSPDAFSTKENSFIEDEFVPDALSTPNPSSNFYGRRKAVSCPQKTVKLSQGDFSTNSIELSSDNDCEVIEITKSFDKADHKNGEMVTSTSSSSSSSSNGSHFDIESDVFSNLDNDQNIHDLDENAEVPEFHSVTDIQEFRREIENVRPVLPVYADLEPSEEEHSVAGGDSNHVQNSYLTSSKTFVEIPKVSGGEAMIAQSSDVEDI